MRFKFKYNTIIQYDTENPPKWLWITLLDWASKTLVVNMKSYIFKTNLFRDKEVSREIEVPEDLNLYKLAEAIVRAYDFDFDHAFGFFSTISESGYFKSERKYELFTDLEKDGIEPTGAESVKKTKIGKVWKNLGDNMLFLFDYGDNWLFVVELTGFGKKEAKIKYPRILKSAGTAPEQYPDYGEKE